MPTAIQRPDYRLSRQPLGRRRCRLPHRHPGPGAAAADAARARRGRRLEHRRLRQRLPRQPAGHARPGDLEGGREVRARPASVSCRRSTRNSAPPRCWARSASSPTPSARTKACSRCGTARARAWTAPATRSSTAMPTAPARTAACWWWPATTMAASARRCRTRATRLIQALHMPVVAPANVGRVPGVRPLRLGAVALQRQLGRLHGAVGGRRKWRHGGPGPRQRARRRLGRRRHRARRHRPPRARPTACTTAGPTCLACASRPG